MCATSAVFDYGYLNPPWPSRDYGMTVPITPAADREAVEAIKKFIAMIEAAKEFDAAAKQPDCTDPKKASFMDEVLHRLAAIEKRLDSLQPPT